MKNEPKYYKVDRAIFIVGMIALLGIITMCLFSSCETQEIKQYTYEWQWNIDKIDVISCTGFDKNPNKADNIRVKITTKTDKVYYITNYVIYENTIEIKRPSDHDINYFDEWGMVKLEITLIFYE